MDIICLELEGVLIPEMWIRVADATHTDELRVTTRDIADYNELMRYRIGVLSDRGISLAAIQSAIADVEPLDGAVDFLNELRRRTRVVILSDTFIQFMPRIMERLGQPLLLCNELVVNDDGMVSDYRLRQPDGKRKAIEAFRSLNLHVRAVGDSFNDIGMLKAAHHGYLFRASETVVAAHPDIPRTDDHAELLSLLCPDRSE